MLLFNNLLDFICFVIKLFIYLEIFILIHLLLFEDIIIIKYTNI